MLCTVKGDVHDIGKNIVGVVLGLQQLPGDRPRRDGAGRDAAWTPRPRPGASLIGLLRADHALPRRDGGRREGDAAARARHPAADRRRDDLAPAHGRADRARLRPTRRARGGRVARRRRRVVAARRASEARLRRTRTASCRRSSAPSTRSDSARRCCRCGIAAERRTPIDVARGGRRRRRRSPATRVVEPTIAELRDVIDWTFFFAAWELKGSFPQILHHDRYGEQARELFADAQELLGEIETDGSLQIRGAYGLWPAASEGDDIVLGNGVDPADAAPAGRPRRGAEPLARGLRRAGRDRDSPTTSARSPSRRGSAPTTWSSATRPSTTTTASIIVKALADRLAEAAAEWLHREVRRAWYAPDESLASEDLIGEGYRGIRPAFGYPACPDHSLKRRRLRPARSARARDGPHGALRDAACGERQRAVHPAPASRGTSTSGRSARTRSRTTRAGSARARSRPSDGSARTSRTTPTERRSWIFVERRRLQSAAASRARRTVGRATDSASRNASLGCSTVKTLARPPQTPVRPRAVAEAPRRWPRGSR